MEEVGDGVREIVGVTLGLGNMKSAIVAQIPFGVGSKITEGVADADGVLAGEAE